MPNLNSECFQLSFDVHIVHINKKLRFFKNCRPKKLPNFRGQTRLLWRSLMAKLRNLGWCSKILQADKDASFHLRWCLGWFAWKLTMQEHGNIRGRIPPPPPRLLDRPNIPALLGLNKEAYFKTKTAAGWFNPPTHPPPTPRLLDSQIFWLF